MKIFVLRVMVDGKLLTELFGDLIAVTENGKMEMPKYFYFRVKVVDKGCGFEVEDASDVDVAEIVRCKYCRYFDISKNGVNGICK